MKKVYGVYRTYCEKDKKLIALYSNDLKAAKRADEEFESDATRIHLMRDVEKGFATMSRDCRKIVFNYSKGLLQYKISIEYSVEPMDVLS